MNNPLRQEDKPVDPFIKTLVQEDTTGTRHPSRFEAKQSTLTPTQSDAILMAQVQRVAALSLATGQLIGWDTKSFDDKGLWNGSTLFTIPSTGKITGPWLFHVKITWPGAGAGVNRQIDIFRNANSIATMQGPATTTGQEISVLVQNPSAGDTFSAKVTQDSGGLLVMTVGATNMFFEVHHPF